MPALNEALQKVRKKLDNRFIQVEYAPSEAILALVTGKANLRLSIPWLSNLLI